MDARFGLLALLLAALVGCGNATVTVTETEAETETETDAGTGPETETGPEAETETATEPAPEPEETVGDCIGSPDGTPCGDSIATECDGADTCFGGECVPNFAEISTSCGDPATRACDQPDSCDGAGTCLINLSQSPACAGVRECFGKPDGSVCGDEPDECDNGPDTCQNGWCAGDPAPRYARCGDRTESACRQPDWCDGRGECISGNFRAGQWCGGDQSCQRHACDGAGTCVVPEPAPQGTPCGSQWENDCNFADTCDGAGICERNFAEEGTQCGDQTTTECSLPNTCNGGGSCLENNLAVDTACGDSYESTCDQADKCDGQGTCDDNYAPGATECGGSLLCDGIGSCGDFCEVTVGSDIVDLPVATEGWPEDENHWVNRHLYRQVFDLHDFGVESIVLSGGRFGGLLFDEGTDYYPLPEGKLYVWDGEDESLPPLEELTEIGTFSASIWPDDEIEVHEFELEEPIVVHASQRLVVATTVHCHTHFCFDLWDLPELDGIATGPVCNP